MVVEIPIHAPGNFGSFDQMLPASLQENYRTTRHAGIGKKQTSRNV